MNITITAAKQTLFELQIDDPFVFPENGDIRQEIIKKEADWGTLEIQHICFGGICILKSELNPACPCHLHVHDPHFCWLTNFVLEGSLQATIAHLPEMLQTGPGQYHAFCSNTIQATMPVENRLKLFSVCLSRHFINRLLGDTQAGTLKNPKASSLNDLILNNEPTTSKLRSIIRDIIQADQPAYIRAIYLQSKVLELLSIQLDTKEKRHTGGMPLLPEKDIRKLYHARALIESNLREPYSLSMLSNKSGLNEFKLKKGFKQLFGNTVFGYLNELRMEKGKQLLRDGHTVNETADAVGYKNAHHFTAAFKKKWGVLPSKIRSWQNG